MTRSTDCLDGEKLASRLFATRAVSQALAAPLSSEDQCAQATEDASPTKWHLAHTTWFFERFLLEPHQPGYTCFDARFNYCFNSYYETLGARQPRAKRGLLTRPSAHEVRAWRAHVDQALHRLFSAPLADQPEIARLLEIGIQHEQQHQELLMTDILALFAPNPLRPAWREASILPAGKEIALTWSGFAGGMAQMGHAGEGFAFDNETPRHDVLLTPFHLANRLVTNAEWRAFMEDGGYDAPTLWLADGWARAVAEGWHAPLYWERQEGVWLHMTLHGLQLVDPDAPVCHISYYEADAFARWVGKRLPREAEWEHAVTHAPQMENAPPAGLFYPRAARGEGGLEQMFGAVWQWTQSPYTPYPGYRAAPGAIGEYNGKFMVSQQVLRGSSCVTPEGHSRITYRNFFYPWQRWQFTGLRLAEDAR